MNEYGNQLTMLLDEVAATINPRADFEAVRTGAITVSTQPASTGGRPPFRRGLAVAAATVALLGGSVAAYQLTSGEPDTVATSSEPTPTVTTAKPVTTTLARSKPSADAARATGGTGSESSPTPITTAKQTSTTVKDRLAPGTHTAQVGTGDLTGEQPYQVLFGTADAGEQVRVESPYGVAEGVANGKGGWEIKLRLTGAPYATAVPVTVSFGASDNVFMFELVRPAAPTTETTKPPATEPPATETKPEPTTTLAPQVEFTANLGAGYLASSPMKQVLYGTASPGSVVTAASDFGSAQVTVTSKGKWELALKMHEVPAGATVHVVVTTNTSQAAFEYWLVRPVPEPPKVIAFTADLGSADLAASPMKQAFYGTGTPGSTVRASSDYGTAEAVVGADGNWWLKLAMYEVPGGTTVGVRITNSASESVFEFSLQRPATQPVVIEFSANAAFTECNVNPPYNEYWGKVTPGSTISISSPYGSGSATANGDGKWSARVEFPSAPVGETFTVTLTSSSGGNTYQFPMTRIG
jgi:hypothetical protein